MKKLIQAFGITVLIIFNFVFTSCDKKTKEQVKKDEQTVQRTLFSGKIVYSSYTDSEDTVLKNTLLAFSPNSVDIYFGENAFRMVEHGGLSHGNVIVYTDKKEAWQIDTLKKIAYLSEYSDLGDPGATIKKNMPDHFAPTVQKTTKTKRIAGIMCTEYEIIRSGFIPAGDVASIWVADSILFPSCRYDFQSEINRSAVPPPLYLGFEEGAVMRLEVKNKSYTRVFAVTEISENNFPPGIFNIPDDYQKK